MASTILEAWTKTLNNNSNIISAIGNNKIFFVDAIQGTQEPYITLFLADGDDTALSLCEKLAGSPLLQANIFTTNKIENLTICNILIDDYQYFRGIIEGVLVRETRMRFIGIRRDPDYEDIYIGSVEFAIDYVKP